MNEQTQATLRPGMTLRSVPTNSLQVGDEYVAWGGLFRVDTVNVSEAHGAEHGACHANISTFLGNWRGDECSIPEHWRKDWNQQGNGLARTALVVQS